MRVIRETPNELTMRFRSVFRWGLATCLCGCGVLAFLVADWATFDCSRNLLLPAQGKCTLAHHTWVTSSSRSWQLEQITGSHVETSGVARNGKPRDYYILLSTIQGQVKLPLGRSEMDYPMEKTEYIRQFLANPQQPSLHLGIDARPYGFFCLILCGTIGLVLFILSPVVTLKINKRTQRWTVQRRRLLLNQVLVYRLDQIAAVITQDRPSQKVGRMGRVVLMLKDGGQVIVQPYDQFHPALVSNRCVDRIQQFLR